MLSLLLALVMVICCIPFGAVGAPRDNDATTPTDTPEMVALEEACKKFNSKITTAAAVGYVYTNLLSAYETYHDARQYADFALAGLNDGSLLTQKTSQLTAATNGLKLLAEPTYTSAAVDGSYTSDQLSAYGDTMSHVLYTEGVGGDSFWTEWSQTIGSGLAWRLHVGLQYGAAVLLYDGINEPALPINCVYGRPSGGTTTRTRLRMMVLESPDFELKATWHGSQANVPGYQEASQRVSYQRGVTDPAANEISSANTNAYLSNTLYFTGVMDTSEYVRKQDTMAYYFENNRDANSSGTFTTAPIYIINYAAYKAIVDDAAEMLSTNPINTLNSEYARQLLGAVDQLTSVNFNQGYGNDVTLSGQSTDWSSLDSVVNSVQTSIETAKRGLDNASGVVNANVMFDLSGVVGAQSKIYNKGNAVVDGYGTKMYTDDSWSKFASAYEDAKDAVSRIQSDGYTLDQTAIDTLIDNLLEAVKGLTYNEAIKVADTSKFDEVRLFVSTLTSTYYTEETYQNLATVVEEQTKVVYPNGVENLPVEDLLQNYVDNAAALVWQAIAGLRLDTSTLQELLRQANEVDSDKYLVGELQTVIGEARVYIESQPDKNFPADPYNYLGVEATQYQEYVELVEKLRVALSNLSLAFSAIEDGTSFNEVHGITDGSSVNDHGVFLNDAIVSKTYFKTEAGYKKYTTPYTVSLWNTADKGVQMHGLGFGGYGYDTQTYNDGGGGAYYQDRMSVEWLDTGTAVLRGDRSDDSIPSSLTMHQALLKQPLSAGQPNAFTPDKDFVNLPANTPKNAPVTIDGQTHVEVYDLTTGGTVDSGATKIIGYKEFAVNGLYEVFYRYTSSWGSETGHEDLTTNTGCTQTITVIDIHLLMDRIKEADQILVDANNNQLGCYTEQTWNNFVTALAAAKENMDYENEDLYPTSQSIVDECQSRYDKLGTAMNGLIKDTDPTHHEFTYEGDGLNAPTCEDRGRGRCTICGYEGATEALGHSYVYTPAGDGAHHIITCSRCELTPSQDDCSDLHGDNMCDVCFGNIYTMADWSGFNEVKDEITGLFEEGCTYDSLLEAKAKLEAEGEEFSFYPYDDAQQKSISDDFQDRIDQQAQALEGVKEGLVPADSSVYDALTQTLGVLNADAYNVDEVKSAAAGANPEKTIEILGQEYTGYDYDDASTKIQSALSTNQYGYHVYVVDAYDNVYYLKQDGSTYSAGSLDTDDYSGVAPEDAGLFHYGDVVTLKNPDNEGTPVKWSMTATAKSSGMESSRKYIGQEAEAQVSVRGEMRVDTCAIDNPNEQGFYKLTFRDSRNNSIIFVDYVDSSVQFEDDYGPFLDNVPFYTVTSYQRADTMANVTKFNPKKDTDIIVNYEPTTEVADMFTINFYDVNSESPQTTKHAYNDKVTLQSDTAVAFKDKDSGKVLYYGSTYTFFACQNIDIEAVSTVDKQNYVSIVQPFTTGTKAYFIGSFALKDGCNVKGYGFVVDTLSEKSNLTLADVSSENFCYNMSHLSTRLAISLL